MSRAGLGVVALVGSVAVWIGTAPLPWSARALAVTMLVVLPVLLLGQGRIDEGEAATLPVVPAYLSSIATIALLALLAVAAARASGIDSRTIGLVGTTPIAALAWTGAVTIASLASMLLARALRVRESPLLRRLIPRTNREKILFVALSLAAGVGEEIAFRGFLLAALEIATGSVAVAVALSSIAFGMLHSYQHVAGVVRATVLGALLAVPVVMTGSLVPAMAAHALIDLVAGLLLADWLLRSDANEPNGIHRED